MLTRNTMDQGWSESRDETLGGTQGHRASRVRMDGGPRICSGVIAGEYVRGRVACRARPRSRSVVSAGSLSRTWAMVRLGTPGEGCVTVPAHCALVRVRALESP